MSDDPWIATGHLPDLVALGGEIIGRSEAAMRRAIAAVPDGAFRATTMVDSFDTERPLKMPCTMKVRGETLALDHGAPRRGTILP